MCQLRKPCTPIDYITLRLVFLNTKKLPIVFSLVLVTPRGAVAPTSLQTLKKTEVLTFAIAVQHAKITKMNLKSKDRVEYTALPERNTPRLIQTMEDYT